MLMPMRLRMERIENDERVSCVSCYQKYLFEDSNLRAPARAYAKKMSKKMREALKSKVASLI
jgi:hypothetical protein